MKLMYVLLCALFLILPACTSGDDEHAGLTDETAEEAQTNRIDIPPTVRSNLGITFAKVERRAVANTVRVPGAFELQPLARHEYRITLPGRVELLVDQYDEVEPGDLLYRFTSPQWPELQHEIIIGEQDIESSRAEIAVAKEKIIEAQSQLTLLDERIDALASAEFRLAELESQAAEIKASLPRLDAELRLAETKLANAERTREHALHRAAVATGIDEATLATPTTVHGKSVPRYQTIRHVEVFATQPGVVESLQMTDGAYAVPPSIVLTTVDPKRVRFRAMGLQSDLLLFTNDASARIVPPQSPGQAINDAVPATLTLGLEADPDQRTVNLLATPAEHRPWTRPGVSAFLEVVVQSTDNVALAIPRSAIVKDGLVHVLFRRDPDDPNKAIRVEADMGVSDGRWVAINSGLMLNDEVVLDGAYELKLATQQNGTSQKGGHFHADGTFHNEE